jgi:hypothetical protein
LADVETTPFSGSGEQAYWHTVRDSLASPKPQISAVLNA